MRKLLFFVVYLIFFGIQITVPQPAWLKFDLVLLFVYAMAMLYGPQTGALTGAAAGLMYDFLSGAVFGFHTITRCMVGFVAGFIKGQVFKEHFAYHIVAALVITAGIRMLFFFVALFLTPAADLTFVGGYLQQSLAYCLGNILFVVPKHPQGVSELLFSLTHFFCTYRLHSVQITKIC